MPELSYQSTVFSYRRHRCLNLEQTMNIFYIIGVVVVVLFVAGYFGLHV
jgi:hypothetical protein